MRGDSVPDPSWIRIAISALWLATAVGVLHPSYRAIGEHYLGLMGWGPGAMWLACAGELVLGLWLLWGKDGWGRAEGLGQGPWGRLCLLQGAAVVGFTVVLAVLDPPLLAHPFGVLSKNLPLLLLLGVIYLHERGGWTPRALRLLRVAVAVPWFTEGLFPKILFQQPMELDVVAGSGLVAMDPGRFLSHMGAAQICAGVGVLVARGALERALLTAIALSLVVLPLLVSWQDPTLWVHPFGPLTKNLPILAGTLVLLGQARPRRET